MYLSNLLYLPMYFIFYCIFFLLNVYFDLIYLLMWYSHFSGKNQQHWKVKIREHVLFKLELQMWFVQPGNTNLGFIQRGYLLAISKTLRPYQQTLNIWGKISILLQFFIIWLNVQLNMPQFWFSSEPPTQSKCDFSYEGVSTEVAFYVY